MKLFLTCIGAGLLLSALAIGLGIGGLEWKTYFAPKHAEIDRKVFQQTTSFVHGKAQHLSQLRLDYKLAASDSHRAALKEMILLEAAAVDNSLLPADIRTFLNTL